MLFMVKQDGNQKKGGSTSLTDALELGKFYFINQKYDEAVKCFEDINAKSPGNEDVLYNLGLCYEMIGNTARAQDCYDNVLALNRKHKLAKKHLEKLLGINK